jgi:hypothetical protein
MKLKMTGQFVRIIFGQLVFLLVVLMILFLGSCIRKSSEPAPPVQADQKTYVDLPRPAWLDKEPLIIIGNWDGMPIFRRRVGGNPVWQEDDYIKEHTEEAVQKLKEIGVTMAVIHYYKGFGLEAEKEQLEDSKKLVTLCKKYGIKIGVYIGSTVGFETMLLEKPEAEGWFVPDYLGQPVVYGDQTFRKRVYFMHPEYIKYIKEVVRIAIEDLKVDLIHFDNTSMQGQPPIFFHPLAIEDFRTFLRTKYTPEMLKKRFGFSDIRYVEPPKYIRPLTIDDPLFQEWADFRCQQLANYYGEMEKYIRGLNPEVAVENNPHSGISGNNTAWDQGVDYPRLLSHTDIVWTEEGNDAGVSNDDILISKIRSYKMATTLKNKIFTYTSRSKLQMAESMVYNRQCLGMVGGALAGYQLPEGQRSYVRYYLKNFEYYRDIENIADVAVLHSFSTMAYNNGRPYQSTFLYEQALIQDKVQFDVIFDDNLKNLSRYKVLVLADQECLSDEKLDLIRNFVKQGGGIVMTGNTSLYTEWRQRKRDFGLRDFLPVEVQPSLRLSGEIPDMAPVRNSVGNGRIVYIPEVIPSMEVPSNIAMTSRYWKLPKNNKELTESVKWSAKENLSLEIEAPVFVTAEVTQSIDHSRLMLHLLNYNAEKDKLLKNLKISLKIPEGKQIKELLLVSPDKEKVETLSFTVKEGRAVFTVPLLEVYDLVVAKL